MEILGGLLEYEPWLLIGFLCLGLGTSILVGIVTYKVFHYLRNLT